MKLYHGSLEEVLKPEIRNRIKGHSSDFGMGFYTTTSYEQAEHWVKIRKKEYKKDFGFINIYEVDNDILKNAELKVLKFDNADESWLDFIFGNRTNYAFEHNYDLVYGKVANDNVYTTINLYEDGFLTKEDTIKRLKTFVLVDQILFHTEKSLTFLKFIEAKKL